MVCSMYSFIGKDDFGGHFIVLKLCPCLVQLAKLMTQQLITWSPFSLVHEGCFRNREEINHHTKYTSKLSGVVMKSDDKEDNASEESKSEKKSKVKPPIANQSKQSNNNSSRGKPTSSSANLALEKDRGRQVVLTEEVLHAHEAYCEMHKPITCF